VNRRALTAVAVVPLLLLLTACGPGDPEPTKSPSATATSTAKPSSTPTAKPVAEPPLPADALLLVKATATADNGAVMDIRMTVHRSLAWSTPEGASMGDVMSNVCAGALEASIYQDQLWTFTALDVEAKLRGTTAWPGYRMFVLPSAGYVAEAITDYPFDDDSVDGGTPHCKRDKFIDGPGSGTVVIGIPGDTDEVSAAGQFTRWANHGYGLTATAGGVKLSECSYLVTTAGEALHGGADWWGSTVNDTHCRFGADVDDIEF